MIEFVAVGTPRPGGSKRGFLVPGTKHVSITDASKKVKSWRETVKAAALREYDGPLLSGALELGLLFFFSRPRAHYGTGRNFELLKPSAPTEHTQKPDTTKLVRAVEDALNGVIWIDDRQIVWQVARKQWVDRAKRSGVRVQITPLQ